MHTLIRPVIVLFLLMTVITGIAYPLVVTGLGQLLFPSQASGSLISKEGKVIGSRLIGQSFSDPKYFWSRPSATAPQSYNALASSGSNQGPLNPALTDAVKSRIDALHARRTRHPFRSISLQPPAVAWIPRSASRQQITRQPGSPESGASVQRQCKDSSRAIVRASSWA